MSGITQAEELRAAKATTNFIPVITEYSWWQMRDGRKFVIVRVRYGFDEAKSWPTTVVFLELDQTEPVERSWQEVTNWVQKGTLIKLSI